MFLFRVCACVLMWSVWGVCVCVCVGGGGVRGGGAGEHLFGE